MHHQEIDKHLHTSGFTGMMELLRDYETPYPQNVRDIIYDRLEREKDSYSLEELQRLYRVSDEAMRAVCEDETREDGLFYCNVSFGLESYLRVAEKREAQHITLKEHELASDSLTAIDASTMLRELIGNCCGVLGNPRFTSHEEGIIRRVLTMLPEEELETLKDMAIRNELSSKAGDSTIIVPRNYERAIVVVCEELLRA